MRYFITSLKISCYFFQEVAAYCPALMEDTEEQLLGLLKDPDETIKEGVVHIISKAGGSFREKVAATELLVLIEQ